MIKIDFSLAIAFYFFSILTLVIGHWIFYNWSEEKGAENCNKVAPFARQCPYCTHLFFDYYASALKICPRCKSYLNQPASQREGENK